jgi:hypothetical protein
MRLPVKQSPKDTVARSARAAHALDAPQARAEGRDTRHQHGAAINGPMLR